MTDSFVAASGPEGLAAAADYVQRCALSAGAVAVGITDLASFDDAYAQHVEWVLRGYSGAMEYLRPGAQDPRQEPAHLFESARCLITVALPYAAPPLVRLRKKNESDPSTVGAGLPIAAYARGRDYHHVLKELLLDLADELCVHLQAPLHSRVAVDSAPLLERQLAERAGYAFIGKNTLAIIPGAGSHFLLGELLVDVQLPTGTRLRRAATAKPAEDALLVVAAADQSAVSAGCGSCRACLDACPTQAFVDEYLLDARLCVSYLTIELRGEIPRNLRRAIGGRVFGCDACQSVCPYNHGSARPAAHPALAGEVASAEALLIWLNIGSSQYRKLTQGSAMRRVTREQFARNVAVALGNLPELPADEALYQAATSHASVLVRQHAMWALFERAQQHVLGSAEQVLQRLVNEEPALYQAEAMHRAG